MIILKLLETTNYSNIIQASNNGNNYEIEVIDNEINLISDEDGYNVDLDYFGDSEPDLLESVYYFIKNTI